MCPGVPQGAGGVQAGAGPPGAAQGQDRRQGELAVGLTTACLLVNVVDTAGPAAAWVGPRPARGDCAVCCPCSVNAAALQLGTSAVHNPCALSPPPPPPFPQAGAKLESAEAEYLNLQEKRTIVAKDRARIEQVGQGGQGDGSL